jgi:hypothetical protein
MAFLTDRTLATGVTPNDLIHIVITGDTSQNPAGSSYKATMGQVLDLINPTTLTGGTYDPITGTITFYDDSGGSFNVTGLITGYTNTAVTAFTYDNANTFTVLENDGTTHSASFNIITGLTINGNLLVTGLTSSGIISATTYQNLPTDVRVTGGTYSVDTATFTNNTGGTFSVSGFTVPFSGGSGNCITDLYVTNVYGCSPINIFDGINLYNYLLITGSTTGSTLTLSSLPTTDTGSTTYYLTRDVSSGLVKTKITSGTPNTGLFSQTGDSTPVSATTSELSVINGGLGSLLVPSNGFSVGDSFRADFGGLLSAKNNDTLRIRVKSGAVVLGDSGAQTMSTTTNDIWGLSLNFTIRNTGVAGVAEIVTIGVFHSTKQSNGNQIGFAFNTINNTTFDTTISNTFDVTAEWSSNSALNSIYSDIFVLNKIF